MISQAGTRWNEATDNDVFLQTAKFISLAHNRRFGQNTRRFLEGSGGNERVGGQRGLGNTQQHVVEIGWDLAFGNSPVIFSQQLGTLDLLGLDELGIAWLGNRDTTEHLTDDHFNVLVVDLDALQTIDVLNFVRDVASQGLDTLQTQDIVRIRFAFDNLFALIDDLTIMNENVLILGNQVLMGGAIEIGNDQTLLALRILAEADSAGVFGQNGGILWRTGFEQLGNARQTTGDVGNRAWS